MNKGLMTRREFCSAGAAISALVFAGEYSLLSAKEKKTALPLPFAVADYADGIGKHVLLTGSEKRFVYRRHNWPVQRGAHSRSSLNVETQCDKSVMTQLLDNAAGKIMMKLEVSGNSAGGIREWNLDSSIDNPVGIPAAKLLVKESGSVTGSSVTINRGKYTETVSHSNPVFALWQLFALVPVLASKTKPVVIDLLDDGMVILPNQRIIFDGLVSFPDPAGEKMEYDSFALYGTGMEPVHFLYHKGGMPQIVTAFMRMYVLESAE